MTDVKESKELLVTLVRLGKVSAKLFGDGLDISDAVAVVKLVADEEFRQMCLDGFSGLSAIDDEFKDMDVAEAASLLKVLYDELQKK
ncbi:MAG: hypothetical protein ACO3FL_04460 [Ilumatobacteraceae bacterium]